MNKAHIVSMGSLLALVAMQKDVQAAMGCLFFDVSNLAWWCGEVKGNVYCENNVGPSGSSVGAPGKVGCHDRGTASRAARASRGASGAPGPRAALAA